MMSSPSLGRIGAPPLPRFAECEVQIGDGQAVMPMALSTDKAFGISLQLPSEKKAAAEAVEYFCDTLMPKL
jgi:hypothetical protein